LTISGYNLLYIRRMCTVGCDWLLFFVGYALTWQYIFISLSSNEDWVHWM